MPIPTLLYGGEILTVRTNYINRIQLTEMNFHTRVKARAKFDRYQNGDLRNKLNLLSITEKNLGI